MTPDQYVEAALANYQLPRGPSSPAEQLGAAVAGPLPAWAGQQLNALEYSGSYAKGTGVHGISDVDVFISLKSDTTNTLKEIYDSLYALAQNQGWSAQRNLSFNWRLILAPEFVLRYLVTHETVHLVIPDHSTKFWLTVHSLCPETERAKQWLCSHQAQLTVDLESALDRAPK